MGRLDPDQDGADGNHHEPEADGVVAGVLAELVSGGEEHDPGHGVRDPQGAVGVVDEDEGDDQGERREEDEQEHDPQRLEAPRLIGILRVFVLVLKDAVPGEAQDGLVAVTFLRAVCQGGRRTNRGGGSRSGSS